MVDVFQATKLHSTVLVHTNIGLQSEHINTCIMMVNINCECQINRPALVVYLLDKEILRK